VHIQERLGAPHRDDLLLANVLNGHAPEAAGAALGVSADESLAIVQGMLRRAEEYAVAHCLPVLACREIEAARRDRTRVLEIVRALRLWTVAERDVVLDVLRGVNVERKYELSREAAVDVFMRALRAMPHYLTMAEAQQFALDPRAWIRNHTKRAMHIVEGMASFQNGYLFRHVEHQRIAAS
jgi:hypothetical protein